MLVHTAFVSLLEEMPLLRYSLGVRVRGPCRCPEVRAWFCSHLGMLNRLLSRVLNAASSLSEEGVCGRRHCLAALYTEAS